jgi:hypothetical protein
MKFTAAAAIAATAAVTFAGPLEPQKINDGDVFSILNIRSGSDFQNTQLQAFSNGLHIKAPAQGNFCGPETPNYAQFQLSNGTLYLFTDNPPQQFFVDRSGMGQGVIQYTTGAQQPVKNGERQGFTVNEKGLLVFKDQTNQEIGFQACPGAANGSYSVWLDSVANPAGAKDCLGFNAVALKEDKPVKCSYTAQ